MVGFDFDDELAAGKHGDKSAVLGDDDLAWVVGDAVIPTKELVAYDGGCANDGGVTIVIDASTGNCAPSSAVG